MVVLTFDSNYYYNPNVVFLHFQRHFMSCNYSRHKIFIHQLVWVLKFGAFFLQELVEVQYQLTIFIFHTGIIGKVVFIITLDEVNWMIQFLYFSSSDIVYSVGDKGSYCFIGFFFIFLLVLLGFKYHIMFPLFFSSLYHSSLSSS